MAEMKPPGLVNQAFLDKMDKLRELSIKSIGLPQVRFFEDWLPTFFLHRFRSSPSATSPPEKARCWKA